MYGEHNNSIFIVNNKIELNLIPNRIIHHHNYPGEVTAALVHAQDHRRDLGELGTPTMKVINRITRNKNRKC